MVPETPGGPALRILTLSTLFPRPDDPAFGRFVEARIRAMAPHGVLTVVAPVAWLDLRHPSGPRLARPLPARSDPAGFQVYYLRWIYPPALTSLHPKLLARRLWPWIRRIHAQSPLDVIDAQFGFPDGVAAALIASRLAIPFTITLRGSEVDHARKAACRLALAGAFRQAAAVIAVSSRLRDFALSLGATPDRAVIIPNGVDAPLFHPRQRDDLRARHGFARHAVHILTAGHLIELKGHHLAVRALATLLRQGIDAHLWIAGGPGRRDSFEPAIRAAVAHNGLTDRVHLIGELPPAQLAEIMAAADLFCLASSREGWPNAVQEALACGTPVVAFDVGAVPDMLPNETLGLIVPAGDVDALAAALAAASTRTWDREAIACWGARRAWSEVGREAFDVLRAASRGLPPQPLSQ